MVLYYCTKCNKEFNKSTNLINHLNRKRPCTFLNEYKAQNVSQNAQNVSQNAQNVSQNAQNISQNFNVEVKCDNEHNFNNLLLNQINKLTNPIKSNNNTCMYCEKIFTKKNNLQRHIKEYCKSKKYCDELEKIKIKFEDLMNNNDHLIKEIDVLKKENNVLKNTSQITTINNNNTLNKNSNNTTNNTNNGTINNNNLNVQLVQYGCENIDDLDIKEALKVYLKSTGGNIVSNMLKFVNLNEKYPQNHNICMSDLSRELVKIFNGKQFIVKKFKDAKSDILGKAIVTTYKIVDKIENDNSIKKTTNDKSKMKINKVSLKLINGTSAEDIVREEIRKAEKLLKDDDILLIANNTEETEGTEESEKEEREFTEHEQMRIEHLENKQQGLQEITLERLKEELYNGKCLVICD